MRIFPKLKKYSNKRFLIGSLTSCQHYSVHDHLYSVMCGVMCGQCGGMRVYVFDVYNINFAEIAFVLINYYIIIYLLIV